MHMSVYDNFVRLQTQSGQQESSDTHFYCGGGGGGGQEHHLLESSQASPARPSGRNTMQIKMYKDDLRMVTVVDWGREILISH
jgi:hypothetical protein